MCEETQMWLLQIQMINSGIKPDVGRREHPSNVILNERREARALGWLQWKTSGYLQRENVKLRQLSATPSDAIMWPFKATRPLTRRLLQKCAAASLILIPLPALWSAVGLWVIMEGPWTVGNYDQEFSQLRAEWETVCRHGNCKGVNYFLP